MSAASTPARTRPALVIPGIESHSLDGKASMMSCHGLPTPPQSALESRRPSLQFSTIAEYAPSACSTMNAFSQPSTPVRGLSRQGDSYNHSWTEHIATTTNTPSNLVHSLSTTHLSQPLLQPAFQSQQPYQSSDIDYLGSYADGSLSHTTDTFAHSTDTSGQCTWPSTQYAQRPLAAEVSSGHGPTLFAMSHSLGPAENCAHDPFAVQTAPSYHHQYHPSIESFHQYGNVQNNIYSQPQVVVPSQLSPQDDYSQQQYHPLASPQNVTGSYSTSFSSSTGSLGDFSMVQPPSPTSAYFAQSDEEDYINIVKFEGHESPSYNATLRRSVGSRSRRRGAKRVRNPGSHFTHIHYTGDTEVVCDGFNPIDGPPVRTKAKGKHFRCKHVNDDGSECGVEFERGEHLKRHAGKHSGVRNFPCPLPNCGKQIQRPDNAADHFKTHLKPAKKGKRNHHFEWIFVRRAIRAEYPEKRATKLLDNLQKWIDAGMPESASQRRGATLYL